MEDQRELILDEATRQFQEKGLKFTMQDLASDMHIAKKTVYHLFPSKEELLIALVENGFQKIHEEKARLMASDLPIEEKIRRVIIAFPDQYRMIDFRRLDELDEKYPTVAACVRKNLAGNWEPTIKLIRQGIVEGKIRNINIPILEMMLTSSFEEFLSTDDLMEAGISYHEALISMMDIIMSGLIKNDG
ncbi:MAG: TetR/AcrR family transcriptional regulator [Solobacterium sp.]|jgi:AcrR family transcriptional regulator|nr:TetR/AcrR family transcriptional regulator [Solobacterium sp.]MCH4222371.1 TetR/AcrR family transcriptional regulator [Solobacterium sp.]MCH4265112.1 TetR/AcrR family transcriptional regulator [Solobacterium sp.]